MVGVESNTSEAGSARQEPAPKNDDDDDEIKIICTIACKPILAITRVSVLAQKDIVTSASTLSLSLPNAVFPGPGNHSRLAYIPDLLHSTAELSTGHRRTQRVLAETHLLIQSILISKVVLPMRHSSQEDGQRPGLLLSIRPGGCTLLRLVQQSRQVRAQPPQGCIVREGDLVRARRKVIRDGITDDLEQLLGAVDRSNGESLQ